MSEPDTPTQTLVLALAVLTVVSGIVDAVSYLGLGRVFTANMTGNIVLVGFGIAGAPGFSVAASLTALGTFVVGAIFGGRLGLRLPNKRHLMVTAISLEAGFVVAAAVIASSVATIGAGWPRYTVISVLGFAMGIRNAIVRRMGVADMTTTVVTTTIAGLASESSLAGGSNPNAFRRATSVVCMFVGATIGAVLVVHVHPGLALGIAAALTVVLAAYLRLSDPHRLGLDPATP